MKTLIQPELTPYPAELDNTSYDDVRADGLRSVSTKSLGPTTNFDDLDPMAIVGKGYLMAAGYGVEYVEYATARDPAIISKIGEQALTGTIQPTDLLEWLPNQATAYQNMQAAEQIWTLFDQGE